MVPPVTLIVQPFVITDFPLKITFPCFKSMSDRLGDIISVPEKPIRTKPNFTTVSILITFFFKFNNLTLYATNIGR